MHNQLDKLMPGKHAKVAFLLDLVLLAVSLGICLDLAASPAATAFALVAVTAAGWGIVISILRLYSPFTPRAMVDNLALALLAVTVLTLGLVAIDRIFLGAPPAHFAYTQFLLMAGTAIGFTQLSFFRGRLATVESDDPVLIVGTSHLGVATYQRLKEHDTRPILGFLRFENDPEKAGRTKAPVLGNADELLELVRKQPVAEVYLAGEVLKLGVEMQKIVKVCEELGLPFAVPLHSLRFNRAQLMSSSKARDGYLHYLNTRSRPLDFAMKRLVDIIGATLGLIALSPLMLLTALIIKLQDGGQVFFRQRRVGLHGQEFNFLKFRSMVQNADALKDKLLHLNERGEGPAFKMKNDPRITAFGRFIRKYSIDELPQLINVLRGDMSLVGPRPPVPREVAEYQPWQRRRLSFRPGLTCYWQVGGRDDISFDEWMMLDLKYVDNFSLSKDIALIFKTIPVVVTGRGAS
jgi:exopolysaccharide biosynthesis polyprenyl glycosylphosphotransferase